MKEEIKWITIWILTNALLALLSIIYIYLNNELIQYLENIITLSLLFSIVPYTIYKYNQILFVEKRSIVIKILQDS